jgi:hypothetical protein
MPLVILDRDSGGFHLVSPISNPQCAASPWKTEKMHSRHNVRENNEAMHKLNNLVVAANIGSSELTSNTSVADSYLHLLYSTTSLSLIFFIEI